MTTFLIHLSVLSFTSSSPTALFNVLKYALGTPPVTNLLQQYLDMNADFVDIVCLDFNNPEVGQTGLADTITAQRLNMPNFIGALFGRMNETAFNFENIDDKDLL